VLPSRRSELNSNVVARHWTHIRQTPERRRRGGGKRASSSDEKKVPVRPHLGGQCGVCGERGGVLTPHKTVLSRVKSVDRHHFGRNGLLLKKF